MIVERVKQQGKQNGIIFTFLQMTASKGSKECGILLTFLIYNNKWQFYEIYKKRKGDKYTKKYRKIFLLIHTYEQTRR